MICSPWSLWSHVFDIPQMVEVGRKLGGVLITGEVPSESEDTPTNKQEEEEVVPSPRDRKQSVLIDKYHEL